MRPASLLVAAVAALLVSGAAALASGPAAPVSRPSATAPEKSADLAVLLGWSVLLDASGTEGHPLRYDWCVARPGSGDLCETFSTDVSFWLLLDEYGEWKIHLDAYYAHSLPDGPYQAPRVTRTIDVGTVIADLAVPELVYDSDDILFDGSGSSWAQDVRPAVSWLVDGVPYCTGEPPPEEPGDVQCSVSAALFSLEEPHVVTLTLSDSESGASDSRQATFTVIDDTVTVNFEWSVPFQFEPKRLLFEATVMPSGVQPDSATWNFGDGTGDDTVPCIYDCLEIFHVFPSRGWYTVTVTVDVGQPPPYPTVSHQVPVDDPPEPVDAHFTATPQPATVLRNVTFATDEPCQGCTFSWDFGDGSPPSSEASPVHAYPRSGAFSASLSLSRDSESDLQSGDIQIEDCGAAPAINQYGYCYGGEVLLEALAGRLFLWSTGDSTATIQVREDGLYWVSVEDVGIPDDCWATAEHLVAMDNCGSTSGDANLDETTDAGDLPALVAELTDGDGTSVVTSSWGTLTAPGGDVDRDNVLAAEDIFAVLDLVFASVVSR